MSYYVAVSSGQAAVSAGKWEVRSDTYPASAGPVAAFTLPAPLVNSGASYTVPGLVAAPVVTVVLRVRKTSTAEAQYMLAAIAASGTSGGAADGTYTNLCYAGRSNNPNAGLAQNAYDSGFTGGVDKTVLDGAATVVITAKFYQQQQQTRFMLYVNGAVQSTTTTGTLPLRYFTNEFHLGESSPGSYTWPGTIFKCQLYLSDLSDADRLAAEASL